jgi:hypothetical protein
VSSGKSSDAGALGALRAPSRTHGNFRWTAPDEYSNLPVLSNFVVERKIRVLGPRVAGVDRGQSAAAKRGMTDMWP